MFGCWEEFEAGPSVPKKERMHVTIGPRSVIHLNGNVYEKLGSPEFVVLLFDRFNSRIGVMPVEEERRSSFPLKRKGRGRHRIIWARPFCKYYGINFDRICSFANPEIDDDGVLRLDLNHMTGIGKRLR